MDALEESQPDKQEVEHAQKLHARIKYFDAQQKDRRANWKKARTYVDGNPNGDSSPGLVRVNLIGSFVETLQASIYAKAPEIAVAPEDRPDEQEFPVLTAIAKTMQSALNTWLVKDGRLKSRGKSAVRGMLTCGTSWVKLLYQKDKQHEPLIKNGLNDIQDNIASIERLRSETQDQSECAGHDAKLVELRQQEKALQSQVEVVVSEGLVIDNVPSEDVIILDSSTREIDEMGQASAIAHRIKMTGAGFKSAFGVKPPGSASMEQPDELSDNKDNKADEDDKIVIVYEVWSKQDNTVYTICKGSNRYIRAPYQPEKLGERWYPFFALQVRRVDGVLYPLSTVELLIELQDEYNTRHTRASEHRRKNIPVRIFNKSSNITDEEIRKVVNRSLTDDVIGVTADPNVPLQSQIASFTEIPFNAAMYDAADVMRDMEMVAGVQDASRGAINKAKTATEAEIMAQGMQSRSSETIDTVEDWLTDMAQYAAHLLMLNLTPEQVQARLGQSAIWPVITGREMLQQVGITIRGGSTARPNKMRERDQWIQLMPMMQEALQKSAELKAAGDEKMARSVLKILQETLNRFDEKLDVKEFLGIELDDNAAQPELPPEVAQQIEQGKMLIQQLQEQLKQAGEALKSKVDEQNMAREKADMTMQTAIEVAGIRAQAVYDAKIASMQPDTSVQVAEVNAASAEQIKLYEVAGQVLTAQATAQAEPVEPVEAETVEAEPDQTPALMLQTIEAVRELAATMALPRTATLSNGKTITMQVGA